MPRSSLFNRLATAAALAAGGFIVLAGTAMAQTTNGHACMDFIVHKDGDASSDEFLFCAADYETCRLFCKTKTGTHVCGFSFDTEKKQGSPNFDAANDATRCPKASATIGTTLCYDAAHDNEIITCLDDLTSFDPKPLELCQTLCSNINGADCQVAKEVTVNGTTYTSAPTDSGFKKGFCPTYAGSYHACMNFTNTLALFKGNFQNMNQCVAVCANGGETACGFSSKMTSTGVIVGTSVVDSSRDLQYGSDCQEMGFEFKTQQMPSYLIGQLQKCICDNKGVCMAEVLNNVLKCCGGTYTNGTCTGTIKKSGPYTLGRNACTPPQAKVDCSSAIWTCGTWESCTSDNGKYVQKRACSFAWKDSSGQLQPPTAAPDQAVCSQCSSCLDTAASATTRECDPNTTTSGPGGTPCPTKGEWSCEDAGCSKKVDGYREYTCTVKESTECLGPKPPTLKKNDSCQVIKGANDKGEQLPNPLGVNNVFEVLGLVIKLLTGVAGSLALLGFVYGGFQLATSGGDSKKVQKGKDTMLWSVLGLALMLTAYFIASGLFTLIGEVTKKS